MKVKNFKYLSNNCDSSIEKRIENFCKLYDKRPLVKNIGGMTSAHLFNLGEVIAEISPKLIVESGVWHGQSTWFIESFSPDS